MRIVVTRQLPSALVAVLQGTMAVLVSWLAFLWTHDRGITAACFIFASMVTEPSVAKRVATMGT
jgi:hypothetical protein